MRRCKQRARQRTRRDGVKPSARRKSTRDLSSGSAYQRPRGRPAGFLRAPAARRCSADFRRATLEHRAQHFAHQPSTSSALRSATLVDSASKDAATASSVSATSKGSVLGRGRGRRHESRPLGGGLAPNHLWRASVAARRFRRARGGSRARRRDGAGRPWNRRFAGRRRRGGPRGVASAGAFAGARVVGDDVADRGEDFLHRRLVGALRAAQRFEIAIVGTRIDCAHRTALTFLRGLVPSAICHTRRNPRSSGDLAIAARRPNRIALEAR